MQLGDVFERFIQQVPISVMFRTLLEHALDPAEIDRLFEENASRQYTREVLFSSIVELMGAVVCGAQPSVRAAYLASLGEVAASLSALYEKLKGLEPGICRAFVRDNAGRLAPLVHQLGAELGVTRPPLCRISLVELGLLLLYSELQEVAPLVVQ